MGFFKFYLLTSLWLLCEWGLLLVEVHRLLIAVLVLLRSMGSRAHQKFTYIYIPIFLHLLSCCSLNIYIFESKWRNGTCKLL